jgi:hypothetical protein
VFNRRKRKAQPDLEAALADLVKSGVTLAEVLCASLQRNTPITPGEIDAIENMIVRTLVDDAHPRDAGERNADDGGSNDHARPRNRIPSGVLAAFSRPGAAARRRRSPTVRSTTRSPTTSRTMIATDGPGAARSASAPSPDRPFANWRKVNGTVNADACGNGFYGIPFSGAPRDNARPRPHGGTRGRPRPAGLVARPPERRPPERRPPRATVAAGNGYFRARMILRTAARRAVAITSRPHGVSIVSNSF